MIEHSNNQSINRVNKQANKYDDLCICIAFIYCSQVELKVIRIAVVMSQFSAKLGYH